VPAIRGRLHLSDGHNLEKIRQLVPGWRRIWDCWRKQAISPTTRITVGEQERKNWLRKNGEPLRSKHLRPQP